MNNQQINPAVVYGNEYDVPRAWINNQKYHGKPWDVIRLALKKTEAELEEFLTDRHESDYWPSMTCSVWYDLVDQQEAQDNAAKENGAAIVSVEGVNGLSVPISSETAWQKYRNKLLTADGFERETVDTIEDATVNILKRLKADTTNCDPVKGMVVGNVQSGKTANMAALMAMAADYGWNMFIVLSGSIENLRTQTLTRLYSDLNQIGNLCWKKLEHPNIANTTSGERPQDLLLESGAQVRYLTVCLKVASRLSDLIKWLQADPNKQQQMRILVIEDEADQASINTSTNKKERKKINQLLCNLVNGNKADNTPCQTKYLAMNYIGYTATPYANLLNEAERESLYPRDFITTLAVSPKYFGPQQIFGYPGKFDGLDIVRDVSETEYSLVKDIHLGRLSIANNQKKDFVFDDVSLPQSLIDSICWFLCGVSCMRQQGYKKPISMLVHTSQKTDHHGRLATEIKNWLTQTNNDEIVRLCEKIWKTEVIRFPKTKFFAQYPNYGRDYSQVHDYPPFADIRDGIYTIIQHAIDPIYLDDTNGRMVYHEGIHLCVDNCKHNTTPDGDDFVRVTYPDADKMPSPAPAFIVVGGATLSRGLTIEGLISTYFLRTVKQADTLMQMGRWFGYRQNYELIPRVWLDSITRKKFEYLSELDQTLRDEIQDMVFENKTPADFGPRVKIAADYLKIAVTAKNRQQGAVPCNMNYSGGLNQTTLFDDDQDKLLENKTNTDQFLSSLGAPWAPQQTYNYFPHTIVWRDIDVHQITTFLQGFHFCNRQRVFNDIKPFTEWMENQPDFSHWNVVVAGKHSTSNGQWTLSNGLSVNKVDRSKVDSSSSAPNIININALIAPRDMLADIDVEHTDISVQQKIIDFINSHSFKSVRPHRDLAGLTTTPQLLIYCIDKDSQAAQQSGSRIDLNAPCDIIGLAVLIPGGRPNKNYATAVHMNPAYLLNNDTD